MGSMKQEALPKWAFLSSGAKNLLKWLQGGDHVLEGKGVLLYKVHRKRFLYLYLARTDEIGRFLPIGKDMAFAGLCDTKDYALYDVSKALYEIAGIPKNVRFPDKESLMREAEEEISAWIQRFLETDWDAILADAACEKETLIPAVDRVKIRSQAEAYYLDGKSPKDIAYRPRFSYGDQKNFADGMYLTYLLDPNYMAKTVARYWLLENTKEASRQRILCGCIREELEEIIKNPGSHAGKVKRLRDAIRASGAKQVVVRIKKRGKSAQFKVRASALLDRGGLYLCKDIAEGDRPKAERIFGQTKSFQVEDIEQVLYKQTLLYCQQDKRVEMEETNL